MVVGEYKNSIRYSAVESQGLGYNVWRGTFNSVDKDFLRQTLKNNEVDIAIITIPANIKNALLNLQEVGFPLIFADVLVYYNLFVENERDTKFPNRSQIVYDLLTPQHLDRIDYLIEDIFHGYKNHYASNPLLSKDIVTVYKEWVRLFIANKNDGRTCWIAKQGDTPIAFIAFEITEKHCEIMLTGVATIARGRSVFRSMLGFLINYCKANGIPMIKVSTQIHNYAAQRAYARQGFLITDAFITVHINSMLRANKTNL